MVVTLSRLYGAGAQGVAAAVGASLEIPVVDRDLPQVVATRLGIGRDAAEQIASQPRPLVERILGGLAISSPETGVPDDIDEQVARGVDTAIADAARSPCVIVGRAAGIVLGRRPGVLRVFLHAPLEWRIRRVHDALRCSLEDARSETQRIDRARGLYIRERYGVDWLDLTRYDLSIDVSLGGIEKTASSIVAFAHGLDS